MEDQSTIYSTENLTKTVRQLPEILRKSFYKATKDVLFVSGDVTLTEFEKWLDNRLNKCFDPISNIITKQEEKPKLRPYKANINARTIHTKSTDKQTVFWLCNQPHRLECEKFIKENLQERKKFVSTNKLFWNCLSKAHFEKQCKSKCRCKINKCGKHIIVCYMNPILQTKTSTRK